MAAQAQGAGLGVMGRKQPKPERSVQDYDRDDDLTRSIQECFREVKKRVAEGGEGWQGWPPQKDNPEK